MDALGFRQGRPDLPWGEGAPGTARSALGCGKSRYALSADEAHGAFGLDEVFATDFVSGFFAKDDGA